LGAQSTQLLMMQTVVKPLDASDDIVLVMQPAAKSQQMHIIGANAAT
jgi:hypothetical protein